MFIVQLVLGALAWLLTSRATVGADTPAAGATPAADGATPSQSQPAQPAAGTTPEQPAPSATDDTDQLGDAGKRALDRMKAERDAAEKERKALATRLEELENATASDQEKAVAAARKEGAAEAEARYQTRIRASEVRAALQRAGMADPDPVLGATEFAALKVSEAGVEGLAEAVQAFKAAHPSLFPPTTPTGDGDGGARGTPAPADTGPGLARLRSVQRNNSPRTNR